MKIEVLKSIKQTENNYNAMISEANDERERRITGAKLEADNLIIRANAEAEEYKKKRLSDARAEVAAKHTLILKEGNDRAAALQSRGKKNLDKAVALLIARFKEQLHVNA
jgi:V/A-type H+/Na+-transporting ATPase subunit G/H